MGYPGSAVIVDGEGCIFENCSFINNGNENTVYGAGIQINANNTRLVNVNFNNNKASSTDSLGGALYVNASSVDVINCTFINNTAAKYGGGIYYSGAGFTLSNSYFYNCIADDLGGAVCIGSGATVNPTISNSTFLFNKVTGSTALGGAVYANKNTFVDGSIFISNYAYQGAVMASRSNAANTVVNSIILNNSAGVSTAAQKLFWSSTTGTPGTFTLNYNWWGNNVTNKNTTKNSAI